IPAFGPRPVRLIEGTGRASLLVATNAARAREAQRYREALGVRIAAHADDAAVIEGGPDVVLSDDELVRPDARAIRVRTGGQGATVVLLRKAGGVLVCGDLDLASEAAKQLIGLEFSAVLSARRSPMWSAGKDTLLQLQRELPKPRKLFSILVPPPWDRAYRGRLEDKMTNHDPIVPREATAPREAAMGPFTLVVARESRDRIERVKKPVPLGAAAAGGNGSGPAAPPRETKRPRPFAEDWDAPGTDRPPTTIANPATDIVPPQGAYLPRPLGERFARASIEDLAGSPYVDWQWGGLSLSPDGSEVAFAWNTTGTFEIYSAPIERERIYQLTDAKERSVSPRWSPDGTQIAFLRDLGGDERFDIWLVDRDGEHERNLTSEPNVMHREIAWSPDGQRIAYAANSGGGGFGIHVVDVATGAKRALTDGSRDDHQPRWSPDGSRLVFWSRREPRRTNADLYLVPAAGGTVTRLDTRGGADGESRDASWDRDGRRLVFTTNVRGREEVAIAHLDGDTVGRIEYLTENIHDETAPVWRPDGRGVVFEHSEESEVSLRRVFAVSHATHAVADRAGVHLSADVGRDSDLVAYLYSGAREPWDVYVTRERMVAPKRLTRSLPATIDPAVLVEPVHVRYPGADGREIPALLYVPHAEALRGGALPPAVMYIHGGPTGQHLRQWDRAAQWFAHNGYVVLAPNIRGSTGYGREFQEANRGDWGGKDLVDITNGAAWLAKQGIADRKRIGAYGGSYGGYMTLMALAQAPDLWAAGVSIVGVVSWKTLYDTTRGDLKDYLERELGDPAKAADLYRDRSPLTHVSRISAPLLLLQGENDPRVPRSEAELMIAALRKSNKPFEEHIYPGEGHGFRTRENMIDAIRRATDWFDRHLQARA
ncbi:MAG TPA: S9 family peptidase, partial [Candidatus Limnocylindria bacterium]|nr:S9 family peptidase [Candidatus Limnocylindria bacterium]